MRNIVIVCVGLLALPVWLAPAFAQSNLETANLETANFETARESRHESAAASDLLSATESLTSRSRLKSQAPTSDAIERLLAADEAVRARFDEVEKRLTEAGVGIEVLTRLSAARSAYAGQADDLTAELRSARAGKSAMDLTALRGKLKSLVSRPAPAILRAGPLPYRRLSLASRSPVLEPAVTPSYLDASDPAATAADTSASVAALSEAPLSEAILLQAEALDYDYVAIYEFVRNEITLDWYDGSMQGAEGVLRSRRGNAVDQASLLISLLRASGAGARYVHGVIELPAIRLMADLGLSSPTAVSGALRRAGVPASAVIQGSQVTAFRVQHTWVSARLPYTNYRGAVVDFTGDTWVPLDAALTRFEVTPPTDVLAAMGFDAETFIQSYLASVQSDLPVERLVSEVEQYFFDQGQVGVTFESQLGSWTPVAERLDLLPSTLPYSVVAVTGENAELEAARRHRVTVRIFGDGSSVGAALLEHDLWLSEAAGQRLTLSYIPATVDDHRTVQLFGGLGSVPAYLIAVRPQLKLRGRLVATGEALPMAVAHALEIELTAPWGTERVRQTVTSGSLAAIGLGAPWTAADPVSEDDPSDTERLGARLLGDVATGFSAAWDEAEVALSRLYGVPVMRPSASVSLALSAVNVIELAGVPVDLDWQGLQLDAALRVAEPTGAGSLTWQRLAGLAGSAFEQRIFEDVLHVEGVSADKGLGAARDAGQTVLTLDAASVGGALSSLDHPTAILAEIEAQALSGLTVEVPASVVTVRDWRGSVWRAEDPATGAAGYFLAGGLAGGSSAVAPVDWPDQVIVEALEDPYAEDANEDPLAATQLVAIPQLDGQYGTVDEVFGQPLGVVVVDLQGRPVTGASVLFQSDVGNGLFVEPVEGVPGAEGFEDLGTQATVISNRSGEAVVWFRSGQLTSVSPVQLRQRPDDLHRSRALRHQVMARVANHEGELTLERPIEAFGFPGEPASHERTDTAETSFLDSMPSLHTDTMVIEIADEFGNPVANAGVTAFASAVDLEAYQDIDISAPDDPPELLSCPVAENPGYLTFFDARRSPNVGSLGSFLGCSKEKPQAGDCGKTFTVVQSDVAGKVRIGVIFGPSPYVRYEASWRPTTPADQVCSEEIPAADPSADAAELCYDLLPDLVDEQEDTAYEYGAEVLLSPSSLDPKNRCTPLRSRQVVTEGLHSWSASAVGTPMAGDVEYALYQLEPAPEDCAEGVAWRCTENTSGCADQCDCDDACMDDGDSPECVSCQEAYPSCLDQCLLAIEPSCEECQGLEPDEVCPPCTLEGYLECKASGQTGCLPPFLACEASGIGPRCERQTFAWYPVELLPSWRVADRLETSEFSATGPGEDASASAVQPSGGGGLRTRVTTGNVPGTNDLSLATAFHQPTFAVAADGRVTLSDPWRLNAKDSFLESYSDPEVGMVWGVRATVTASEPEEIHLTDQGFLESDVVLSFTVEPADYAPLRREMVIYRGDEVVHVLDALPNSGGGEVRLPRGTAFDLGDASYEAQLVLNSGTASEVRSAKLPLQFARQLIRDYSRSVRVSERVDLTNERRCPTIQGFSFRLNHDAAVRLDARRVEGQEPGGAAVLGPPTQVFAGSYQARETGASPEADPQLHVVGLTPNDLPPGDYRLTLTAMGDGRSDQRTLPGFSAYAVNDSLPVGHTLQHGVDLWNGALSISRGDLSIPGRGPALEFSRTYSSSGGANPGSLGLGWNHNLGSKVMTTDCGEVVVIGGEGSGQRFTYPPGADPTAGDPIELIPQRGYHGTLVQRPVDNTFDFYTLTGNRYHYEAPGLGGEWQLQFIEDPDGNRQTLTWGASPDGLILTEVTDSAGRQLQLSYEGLSFVSWSGQVITRVTGPGGLEMSYDYDEWGNLVRAARQDGPRSESYAYDLVPDWNFETRPVLIRAQNELDSATTSYAWNVQEVGIRGLQVSGLQVTGLQVSAVTLPEGGTVGFAYDAQALSERGGSAETVMTDRRGEATTFRFDEYGASIEIIDPLGFSSEMSWATNDVLLESRRDANGVLTRFTYDEYGNVLTETTDGQVETRTYFPPSAFDPPYQTNRLRTRIDRNGHTTNYTYNHQGHLLSQETALGGTDGVVRVEHTYDARGDLIRTRDARGHETTLRYDFRGYPVEILNALSHRTLTSWNERGLQTSQTDALNRVTELIYDGLDRLLERRLPGGDVERFTYDDTLDVRTQIDPEGRTTTTYLDLEGRVTRLENAVGGVKVYEYDGEGLKTLESSWFDDATPRSDVRYDYDAAGRLARRIEPQNRVTLYEHDAVGNQLAETLIEDVPSSVFGQRRTTMTYDAFNRPVTVTRHLASGTVVTTMEYDGEGNKLREIDAEGREMTMQYDGLNRLRLAVESAGLRQTETVYDGNGNIIRTLLSGPDTETQTRELAYDAINRLTSQTDAEGEVSTFDYDDVGNLIRTIDRRGNVLSREYDLRNREVRMRQHLDRLSQPGRIVETVYTYDGASNKIGEQWPNGNVITHTYDDLNRLTASADAIGSILSASYDARSRQLTVTDANGNVTASTYDDLDRLIRQDLPENRAVVMTYDTASNVISHTDPKGNVATFEYDRLDRRVGTVDPAPFNYTTSTGYDKVGNVLSETDRRGHVTSFQYDDLNRLIQRTEPAVPGGTYTMAYTYDAADNRLTETDRRGLTTEYSYDRENRRIQTKRAGLVIETIEVDASGNPRLITDANGNTTGLEYDERDLILRENRPESASARHTYDDQGNRTQTLDPNNKVTKWAYDPRNRQTRQEIEVAPNVFAATVVEYDGQGNRTVLIKPQGGRWQYTYDGAHRLKSVTAPESGTTSYTYDASSNLIEQRDATNQPTSYVYDELNRRREMTYADGAIEQWSYDENSNLVERTDPKGQLFSYEHDALNRETRRVFPVDPDSTTYLTEIEWTLDPNNNLIQIDESEATPTGAVTQTSSRTYDAFDRLETTIDRWGHTVAYTYDANGNRTGLSAPEQQTSYAYDALNRLATVSNAAGLTEYEYFQNSRLKEVRYPNGTNAAYTFDEANRLETIENRQGTSTLISGYVYAYDHNGNRTQQFESQLGRGTETTTYTYDTADRLLEVDYPEKVTLYTYDEVGNRLSEVNTPTDGSSAEEKAYSYNNRHQLETITFTGDPTKDLAYTYDANGNQTSRTVAAGDTTQYVFDPRNQVQRVEQNGTPVGTYDYDYQGLRIRKYTDHETRYVYDAQSVLQRHDDTTGTITYDYGPDRLLSVDHPDDGRAFYLFDGLGSVTNLTTPGGSMLAQYQYDAWGNYRYESGTDANIFGFTGHEHDAETGLIYAKARFYDPETARFLSNDPVAGSADNPPSLHRYLYAFQNPTVYVDPDGRENEENQGNWFTKAKKFLEEGADAAIELAGEVEFGDSIVANVAERVTSAGLGVVSATSNITAGLAGGASTATNVVVAGFAPNTEAGQQAALELEAQLSSAKETIKTVIEDPIGVGAGIVEGVVETGKAIASGDKEAIATAAAFVGEVALSGGAAGVARGGVRATARAAGKNAAKKVKRANGKTGKNQARQQAPEQKPPEQKTDGRAVSPKKCFVAGTLVATVSGLKPIEEVVKGDEVWSRDEASGEIRLQPVVELFVTPDQQVYEITIQSADGEVEVVETTAEHPFYVMQLDAWVPASRLQPGDELLTLSGETGLTVRQVRGSPRRETVYNFEVAVDHSYFVGDSGVWVHNDCELTLENATLDEQVQIAVDTVGGLDERQARFILSKAFEGDNKTSVVFGGSRVRGDFTPGSDIDIGFGNLTENQAFKTVKKVRKDAERNGGLRPDPLQIVPGKKTATFDAIESPEEFFQRSGTRSLTDPNKPGEPFHASGSLTLSPDGKVRLILPPGFKP